MRSKIVLSLSSIAAVLFLSSVISIIEYGRMSDYVSRSLLEDMERNSAVEKLADACRKYNLTILASLGTADSLVVEGSGREEGVAECDSAALAFSTLSQRALADSVLLAYNNFMELTQATDSVIVADFINTREWYFTILQPTYNKLIQSIQIYKEDINADLMLSADDFQDSFYRGIIPGIVVTGAGLLLIFLLMFFLLIFYVSPLRHILFQLDAFNKGGIKKYNVDFEGEDELSSLNHGIKELADENIQLKRRIRALKKDES